MKFIIKPYFLADPKFESILFILSYLAAPLLCVAEQLQEDKFLWIVNHSARHHFNIFLCIPIDQTLTPQCILNFDSLFMLPGMSRERIHPYLYFFFNAEYRWNINEDLKKCLTERKSRKYSPEFIIRTVEYLFSFPFSIPERIFSLLSALVRQILYFTGIIGEWKF